MMGRQRAALNLHAGAYIAADLDVLFLAWAQRRNIQDSQIHLPEVV